MRPLPHLPGAGGWPAACGWSQAARQCQQPAGVYVCVCVSCAESTLPRARQSGVCRAGGLGETVRGRGPLLGPWWVGERPPGSGCEARPSLTATINMFVQGKPGWERCALA